MEDALRPVSACFTGYRGNKFPFSLQHENPGLMRLCERLEEAVQQAANEGYTDFYCGGAWGFDILAGEAVLRARQLHEGLRLYCILPHEGQARGWDADWLRRYERMLHACTGTKVLSREWTRSCYHERNRYMVDRCSRLICYFDGQPGGTAYTVRYALQKGVRLINLAQESKLN